MKTLRSTLCIAFVLAFISSGLCCTEEEWECESGQCISADEICDGIGNCADVSDETENLCVPQHCPVFAYRCAYGGCVPKSALCNGIKDCVDNSDEDNDLCQGFKLNNTTAAVVERCHKVN